MHQSFFLHISTAATKSRSQREVLDALADVVSVEPNSNWNGNHSYDTSSASYSGQAPMAVMNPVPTVPTKDTFDPVGPASRNRKPSNGQQAPPPPAKSSGLGGRFANAFRRHNTDEKDAKRREKEKRMQRAIDEAQPTRMDVIDRMDLSGLGASLFHHDSPYDACSPHRNHNSRRAPVNAFDPNVDPMTGLPIGQPRNGSASGSNKPGLSPLAQATMRKMSDSAGDVGSNGKDQKLPFGRGNSATTGQLPKLNRNQTTASAGQSEHDTNDAASSVSQNSTYDRAYYNAPSNVSRGRADVANPNADIWGVTSEPWQDFALPASTRHDANSRRSSNDGLRSSASSVFDMEAVMTGKPSTRQPIGGSSLANGAVSPGESSGGSATGTGNKDGPKRSKSLVKRIKYARQYGNVPPPDDDVVERAEALAAQNEARSVSGSARHRGLAHHHHSPSTPPMQSSSPSLAQGTTTMQRSGTLKATGNADDASYASGHAGAQSGNNNLGRKNSVFGRFRGKSREQRDVAVAR